MCRPWNAQVLEAMQRIRDRGALQDPLAVYRELQNDPDLPPSVARDAVPLAELMEAAPHARHAPAYAIMVVESGIRNRLCIAGCRMVQASETGELEEAWRMAGTSSQRGRWLHGTLACPARPAAPRIARADHSCGRHARYSTPGRTGPPPRWRGGRRRRWGSGAGSCRGPGPARHGSRVVAAGAFRPPRGRCFIRGDAGYGRRRDARRSGNGHLGSGPPWGARRARQPDRRHGAVR